MGVDDCGILHNYFRTLCEMPTDTSVGIGIGESVGTGVDDCGISRNYCRTLYEMPTNVIPSVSLHFTGKVVFVLPIYLPAKT